MAQRRGAKTASGDKTKPAHEHTKPRHGKTDETSASALGISHRCTRPRTELLAPNVIAVHQWDRLRSGALIATTARVDWASLLRRTFDVDVLECPKCAGRIRVLVVVDDKSAARKLLDELGVKTTPTPRARTRSLFADDDDTIVGDAR